jgi:uncharacterized damage-inducible protein DinB
MIARASLLISAWISTAVLLDRGTGYEPGSSVGSALEESGGGTPSSKPIASAIVRLDSLGFDRWCESAAAPSGARSGSGITWMGRLAGPAVVSPTKPEVVVERNELIDQVLATWHRHNEILLYLLQHVPPRGLGAVPAGSRGRDVARQFAHLNRTRIGWLQYHETGKRPKLPSDAGGKPPTKAQLGKALRTSGKRVEAFLDDALRHEARPRLFGKQAIRWMGYLIAHESHHRGQILLALKQTGMRLPDRIAVQGLWGRWIFGK